MLSSYGRLFKNPRSESVPLCEVFFVELNGSQVSEKYTRKIPLTSLSTARLGSIWYNQNHVGDREFQQKEFVLNFKQYSQNGGEEHKNFEILQGHHEELISASSGENSLLHIETATADKFIVFMLDDKIKVFIPCIEFLVQTYGCTPELTRILTTYNWDEIWRRLNFSKAKFINDNEWFVEVPKGINSVDASLLSHLRFNKHTKYQAKHIHSSLDTDFTNHGFSYLYVKPWHEEKIDITVSGIWINDNKSFVVHKITGISLPQSILTHYENEKNLENTGSTITKSLPTSNSGTYLNEPKVLDITSPLDPARGLNEFNIESEEFKILGKINTQRHKNNSPDQNTNVRGGNNGAVEASGISLGEPHGTTGTLLKANVDKPVITSIPSDGILLDFWRALLKAQERWPKTFVQIEWFTFEEGFTSEGDPNLIALSPFTEEDSSMEKAKSKTWIYRDIIKKEIRGVLYVRCSLETKKKENHTIYFIEVQRRLTSSKTKGTDEENLQGLVYKLDDDQLHQDTLKGILSEMRYTSGVMKKIPVLNATISKTFSHSTEGVQEFPCELAMINAFSKMGFLLPRFKKPKK
jgi:hypothetical protein